MKKIFNYLIVLGTCSVLFAACKKDDSTRVTYLSGTDPVLTGTYNTSASDVSLAKVNSDKVAMNISWTNPEFQFTDGISSQDVNYTIEIDKDGNNFASAAEVVVVAKELSYAITQGELNKAITKSLELPYGVSYNLDMRVVARINQAVKPALVSNVIKFTTTPYLDVAVELPVNSTLWVTGNAFASGWSNPLPAPYDATQKFTKVSETLYELTVNFIGGGGYKIIQVNGDWSSQYHALDGTAIFTGSFEKKDSDPQFPGPADAGTYKISVDFITGKYTVVKQ